VLEKRGNNLDFSDFSVLTRASWQSNYVQAELMKRQIPFVVVGGIKFSERRHVKDIVAFLKLTVNPLDAVAWHRILQLIEGIGKVKASEIVMQVHANAGRICFDRFLGRKYYEELHKLELLFDQLNQDGLSPVQMLDLLFPFYIPRLKQIEDDYEVRIKDLETFRIIAGKYEDLQKFLADFTLEPPSNRYQDQTTPLVDTDEKPLVVSTIHSAKGLEWHTVFIPHALDGLLPSVRSMETIQEMEEERRLFYVAASRAKENLFITMPSYISSWDAVFNRPSRFLAEVDKKKYELS
jgi:DNA helicase II / ATP-dependent DNA helicase PcrA